MTSKATIKAKAMGGKAKAAAKWKSILKAKGAAKAQAKDPAKAKAKVKVKATTTATKKEAAAKAAEKATSNDTDKAAAAKAEKEAAAKAAAEEEKKAKTLLWSKFHSSLARACPAIKEKWSLEGEQGLEQGVGHLFLRDGAQDDRVPGQGGARDLGLPWEAARVSPLPTTMTNSCDTPL